jgi:YD repeat-containing protein
MGKEFSRRGFLAGLLAALLGPRLARQLGVIAPPAAAAPAPAVAATTWEQVSTYTYDFDGRLLSRTDPFGPVVTYTYTSLGSRTRQA